MPDWKPFLQRWSRELIDSELPERLDLPTEAVQTGWLGFPGATEDQIAALEKRLDAALPPSYREFLAVTNGWLTTGTSIDRLWGVEGVEWFRVRHLHDWIEPWTIAPPMVIPDAEYFNYGPDQDPTTMRAEYLPATLEISDVGDAAILLLNPKVITAEGEWEAWHHASWLPGASRFRSFWELMQELYQYFQDAAHDEARRFNLAAPLETLPGKLSDLVEALEEKARQYRQLPMVAIGVSYHEGSAVALEQAAQAVRDLGKTSPTPQALLDGLRALQQRLSREAREGQPSRTTDIFGLLRNLTQASQFIFDGGVAVGKGQASGIIDWFLKR